MNNSSHSEQHFTDGQIIPLVVDLDGTLITTDLLMESFYAMIRQNPWAIIFVPIWLLKGKVFLKNKISERAKINVQTLPYHEVFLNYLKEEHDRGKKLVLATASARKFAERISEHMGIFADCLASDERTNLKGKAKLKELLERYGEKGFDYAGNDLPDLHIFPYARKAILVNPPQGVLNAAKKVSAVEMVFDGHNTDILSYIKAARVYQWVKNLLLFVPLLMSHQWSNVSALTSVVLGFVSFSFCASGGYVFNDFMDLPSDRGHPRKKNRPFAGGNISLWTGSFLMVGLKVVGLAMAFALSWKFFALLVLYSLVSLVYTFHLKTYVLIDILILASLYTMRVLAGALLIDVSVSFWLFAFSIFIFFSLAMVKRCSELVSLKVLNRDYAQGRDYSVSDIDYLREMGITSGYMAILIIALYINSPDVMLLYSHPKVLWLMCPAIFYWISRIWLKTGRGEMHDDPIVFSAMDRGSRIVAIVIILTILLAI